MPTADKIQWTEGNPLFNTNWRTVSEGFDGNGILSSGDMKVTATATDLEIQVASGDVWYNGSAHNLASADAHTLSSGDGSDDRWDTVAFDTSSDSSVVIKGSANSTPEPPDIGSDRILLAVVYVPANATDVNNSNILNWRNSALQAENIHYSDGTGTYSTNNLASALDDLQEAVQISAYPLAQTDLATGSVGSNEIIDGSVTSTDISDGTITLTDMSNPFGLDELTDLDVDSNDLVDGGTTIWDTSNGFVPRAQIDIDRITSTVSSNTTTSGEEIIFADTSSSALTVTLASSDAVEGRSITIVDLGGNAGTNSISIDTESTEGIDGGTTDKIETDYSAKVFHSDGSDWYTGGGGGGVTNPFTENVDGGGFNLTNLTDLGATNIKGSVSKRGSGDSGKIDNLSGNTYTQGSAPSSPQQGDWWIDTSALTSGTFDHTTGSSTTHSVTGVTTTETEVFDVVVSVDTGVSSDYAFNYEWSQKWDNANGEIDVEINVHWDNDPGSNITMQYTIQER